MVFTEARALSGFETTFIEALGLLGGFLVIEICSQFYNGQDFVPEFYSDLGNAIAVIFSMFGAVYAIVKVIDAAVKSDKGLWYMIRGYSWTGDFL